jgi:pyruvate kinase
VTFRRTKLVCTIGPATAERVPDLVESGMDVARISFSHGTPASRTANAEAVRSATATSGRPVGLLADLAGPKIRLGPLAGGQIALEAGQAFVLRPGGRGPGSIDGASVSYPRLATDVQAGDRILIADGAAELRVTGVDDAVATEVVRGGIVGSNQGVSIPSAHLSAPALTPRDRRDIPRLRSLAPDHVALSFVRRPEDIVELRSLIGDLGASIIAKIETRAAIDDFDAILGVADGVMIARGDMGVELPYEEVPIIQKQLVRRAIDRGVPCIVATQMLESMIVSVRPTRAEASDVANAVFDGADAIMLSGETAIGAHPILAAEAAVRIIDLCEQTGSAYIAAGATQVGDGDAEALVFAATTLAQADRDIGAIACYTRSGRTARMLAARRPRVPILAYSPDPTVVGRLSLVHGVRARSCEPLPDTASRLGLMARRIAERDVIPAGSAVVLVASTAEAGTGPNLLEVHRLRGA